MFFVCLLVDLVWLDTSFKSLSNDSDEKETTISIFALYNEVSVVIYKATYLITFYYISTSTISASVLSFFMKPNDVEATEINFKLIKVPKASINFNFSQLQT